MAAVVAVAWALRGRPSAAADRVAQGLPADNPEPGPQPDAGTAGRPDSGDGR